jgi:hypothetical protein
VPLVEQEFEDTKGAIRIRISKKDRQHNGQKKKDKQRSTKHTHKTKDRVTQTLFYFSGVRVTRSLVLCVMFYFSGVCVTRSLVLCVMFYFSGVCVTRSLVLCVCFVKNAFRFIIIRNNLDNYFRFLSNTK